MPLGMGFFNQPIPMDPAGLLLVIGCALSFVIFFFTQPYSLVTG
jgi:hypothetical protein